MERTDLQWSRLLSLTKDEVQKLGVVAGAFRISHKSADGQFYVVFVGSAADIKKELLEIISSDYDGSPLFKSYLQTAGEFAFKYVGGIDDEASRRAIEKQMYKHYAPRFNDHEPISALDLKVNLS